MCGVVEKHLVPAVGGDESESDESVGTGMSVVRGLRCDVDRNVCEVQFEKL